MTYLPEDRKSVTHRGDLLTPYSFETNEWPCEQYWPYYKLGPLAGWSHFKVDMIEDDKNVVVHAELPGVHKENIQAHVDDGILTIQAEKKHSGHETRGRFHFRESSLGVIRRSIKLPVYASVDAVQSTFEKGILNLVFPKNSEKENKKTIKIN